MRWHELQASGQDALERRVLRRAVAQGADAGAFQALGTSTLGQAQDALRDVQPVLGTMLQQLLDDLRGGRPDAERPRPADVSATDQAIDLVRWQVGQEGLALAGLAGAVVRGHRLMVDRE